MTPIDRFELELPSALSDVAGSPATDYLTDILGRTARTRQRSAWASLERWLPMDLATSRVPVARIPWRPIAAVALLILVLLALLAVYAGGQRRVPAPFGPAANGLIPYSVNGDILVGDPVTGRTRLVVGGPEEDYNPGFSSDGTLVAFLRGVSDGVEAIVVADEHGGNVHTINPAGFQYLDYAQWVPGRHDLLVAYRRDGRYRLEVFDAAGATQPRLLLEDARVYNAQYRPPAGNELVVEADIAGTVGLYAMDPDGTHVRLLTATKAELTPARDPGQDLNFPVYSPDGSRIYYNRYTPEAGTIQAWVMNADGSNQRRFNADGPPCCWWEGEMAPSPDGKSVLMWRVDLDGSGGNTIAVFPVDGSGDGRAIGPKVAGTAHWMWSPDSTKVLLNFGDPNEGDQGLIDPATGAFTTLPWNADTEPEWQRTLR